MAAELFSGGVLIECISNKFVDDVILHLVAKIIGDAKRVYIYF